jgi:hypothetical protein
MLRSAPASYDKSKLAVVRNSTSTTDGDVAGHSFTQSQETNTTDRDTADYSFVQAQETNTATAQETDTEGFVDITEEDLDQIDANLLTGAAHAGTSSRATPTEPMSSIRRRAAEVRSDDEDSLPIVPGRRRTSETLSLSESALESTDNAPNSSHASPSMAAKQTYAHR